MLQPEEAAVRGPEAPFSPSLAPVYARLEGCSGSCVTLAFGPVGQPSPGRVCLTVHGRVVRYAPGLLSHFGSASVSISLCIWSMLVAWLLVLVLEVRSPAGVHMRAHTHRLRSPLCGWKSHVVLYGGRVP